MILNSLADTQGTLVRTNRFNREIGELALNYFELDPSTTSKSVAAKAGCGGRGTTAKWNLEITLTT
jgi:hypothetical protein